MITNKFATTHGTVMFFSATLSITNEKLFSLPSLKKIGQEAVNKIGLGLRRIEDERYPGKDAYTLIFFLNESHLALTTYPENGLIELEVASCKTVSLTEMIHWLKTIDGVNIKTSFCIDKNDEGKWEKSL